MNEPSQPASPSLRWRVRLFGALTVVATIAFGYLVAILAPGSMSALDEESFGLRWQQLERGQSRDEVRRLLGPPDESFKEFQAHEGWNRSLKELVSIRFERWVYRRRPTASTTDLAQFLVVYDQQGDVLNKLTVDPSPQGDSPHFSPGE